MWFGSWKSYLKNQWLVSRQDKVMWWKSEIHLLLNSIYVIIKFLHLYAAAWCINFVANEDAAVICCMHGQIRAREPVAKNTSTIASDKKSPAVRSRYECRAAVHYLRSVAVSVRRLPPSDLVSTRVHIQSAENAQMESTLDGNKHRQKARWRKHYVISRDGAAVRQLMRRVAMKNGFLFSLPTNCRMSNVFATY